MDELGNLKLPELKKECKARGLATSGNKADLITRLQVAMSTEKPPSDDSVLDDALIDEDSMLGDDSGAEDSNDLTDLTLGSTHSILISPTSRAAPTSISASPTKIAGPPVKNSEALKRSAPGVSSPSKQTNGSTDGPPASKKKITINREPVEAPPPIESDKVAEAVDGEGDKKVVKIAAAVLTSEEKAKLRAQKFGAGGTAAITVASDSAIAVTPISDEKLKKRAERFGSSSGEVPSEHKVISLTTEDDVKIAKRKERFGVAVDDSKKESRAARFATESATATTGTAAAAATTGGTTTADSTDKKQLRAARFGNAS